MKEYLSGYMYALTDTGKIRKQNEDSCDCMMNAFGELLLIVADGMGGANKGDYASKVIVKKLADEFENKEKEFKKFEQAQKWLYKVINAANRTVYSKAHKDKDYLGAGSTLTVALISQSILLLAQVGDSRLYRIKDKKLEQLSVDQTYVQYLIRNKKLEPKKASSHPDRHKLTNALGIRYNANVEFSHFEYHDETLLLCSDGLYNNIPERDIESILRSKESAERKCYQLIAFANANGGSDNITTVIWESNR